MWHRMQGFLQDFFLRVGNVDACNRRTHMSIHPQGFVEILDMFKDKNDWIQLKPAITCMLATSVRVSYRGIPPAT